MADDAYIALPIDADYDALNAATLDYLVETVPGWLPRDGHLEVWLALALNRSVAELLGVASRVPPEIFRYFGQSILAVPALETANARMPSTWLLTDTLGHTITAGSVVAYQSSEGPVYFTVETDVTVPPGQSETATGEVILVALDSGAAANGLPAGVVSIVDALAWVNQVTTTAVSSGGVDAESPDDYLDRLRSELRLLTPRPIRATDFAVLARRIPGVDRSVAIDGYNSSDGSYNNERIVAVAVADTEGQAVTNDVKQAVKDYLESLREVNFVVSVIDPTYTVVDVTATLHKSPSADAGTVVDEATLAVRKYLSPDAWDWSNIVRRNELIVLLDQVPGVEFVDTLNIPSSDVILPGVASLVRAGTVAISVV